MFLFTFGCWRNTQLLQPYSWHLFFQAVDEEAPGRSFPLALQTLTFRLCLSVPSSFKKQSFMLVIYIIYYDCTSTKLLKQLARFPDWVCDAHEWLHIPRQHVLSWWLISGSPTLHLMTEAVCPNFCTVTLLANWISGKMNNYVCL